MVFGGGYCVGVTKGTEGLGAEAGWHMKVSCVERSEVRCFGDFTEIEGEVAFLAFNGH